MAHYALVALLSQGLIHHVISQNVDGLHFRSGMVPRDLTELHGNIFMEVCTKCHKEYLRPCDVGGMGLRLTGNRCTGGEDVLLYENGLKDPVAAVIPEPADTPDTKDGVAVRFSERRKRKLERPFDRSGCGGYLRDHAVDWDTSLPEDKFQRAQDEIQKADLVITLGTSLRIRPAGFMPEAVLKKNKKGKKATVKAVKGKEGGGVVVEEEEQVVAHLVVVNLQKTHVDERATLVVHARCDEVMRGLCDLLGVSIIGDMNNPTMPPSSSSSLSSSSSSLSSSSSFSS